jgi:transcription factor WhiB
MTSALLPRPSVRRRTTTPTWNPAIDGGSCNGTTFDWVPELYDDDAEVRVPSVIVQLCDRCPFKGACLEWAMNNDAYGYWAGTSRYQRLQLSRERHRVKCPSCGSTGVVPISRAEVCTSCGISWVI